MTYRYTEVNVLEDALGHRVEIRGRTNIHFGLQGREIVVGSEMLAAGYGFAIYRDWSKLIAVGNGGPSLTNDEVEAAILEIAKALRDVGTSVEIVW